MLILMFSAVLAVMALHSGPTLARTQDPAAAVATKPIRISLKATRVPVLLQQLSGEIGTVLACLPVFENDVVILDSRGLSQEAVLNEIAYVVCGKWEKSAAGLRLIPDTAQWQKDQREDQATAAKELRKQVFSRANPPKKSDKPGEDDEMGGDNGSDIAKVLLGLDLTRIANLRPEERLVYSTSPTRMQLPLPDSARGVVAKLVAEHNEQVGNAEEPQSAEEIAAMAMMPESMKRMMRLQRRPITGYTKANLVIASGGFLGGSQATLTVYNAKGEVVLMENDMLGLGGIFGGMMGAMGEAMEAVAESLGDALNGQEPTATAPEAEIKISPRAKEISRMLNLMSFARTDGTTPTPPSDEVMRILAQPDQFDPLSFQTSEIVMGAFPKPERSMVACLADSASEIAALLPSEIKKQLGKNHEISEEGNVVRIRPKNRFFARRDRSNRTALAQLIQSSQNDGAPSLKELAAYASRAAKPEISSLSGKYLLNMVPSTMSYIMMGTANWGLLRWYGSLDGGARGRILTGAPVNLAAIPSGPTSAFLYSSEAMPGPIGTETDFMTSMMSRMMPGGGGADYSSEPTEVMPAGVPAQGTLTVTTEQEYFVVPADKKDMGGFGGIAVMGIDELAIFEMFSSTEEGKKQMTVMASNMPKTVLVGNRSKYTFRFRVSSNAEVVGSLYDDSLDKKAAPIPFGNLPGNVKAQVTARAEKLKKSPFGQMMSTMGSFNFGQGGPPP